jgi:hypothetical protein
MKLSLTIFLLVFILAGCNNPTNVPDVETRKIFGTWSKMDDTNQVTITLDEKGNYFEKRKGIVVVQTTFRFDNLSVTMTYPINFQKPILNCGKRWLHAFSEGEVEDILKLQTLFDNPNCKSEFVFVRKK